MPLKSNLEKIVKFFSPAILWLVVVLILYIPLLKDGGIIIDDWGGLASNFQCSSIFDACFFERYQDAFHAVFANRPLAPLPIVLSTVLFKTNFSYYLYLNTSIFLAAILIVSWVINKIVNHSAALIFAYVAVIPFISMPLVVSPINLMDSTIAYLFWSISLYLLYSYCNGRSYIKYFVSYLLLVFGFFTYEVFLPLLTMNACIPYLVNQSFFRKNQIRYIFEFILPLLIVLFIVYFWQKIIGPNLYHFHSRLNFNWSNIAPSFVSWLGIFFYDAPVLFSKARKFLSPNVVIGSLIYVIAIAISWKNIVININLSKDSVLPYFALTAVCFLGSSSILILSGATADVGGYDARALSSIWICFALLCSGVAGLFYKKWPFFIKKVCAFMCLLILFYSCLSFLIQRDNYIKSWEIQTFIINDALELIAGNDLEKPSIIIGNVPAYLERNYNNELIFNTHWDFTAALQVFTNRLVKGGPVIDARGGNFHNLRIIDGMLLIDGVKVDSFNNVWFYDFDPVTNKGSLVRMKSIQDLKSKLSILGNPTYLGEIGRTSAIERNEPIDFSQDWINRHHFIKDGFSERETWGVWSSGKSADLILPVPANGANGLRLEVRAFVLPHHSRQRIEVTVNGRKMAQLSLTKSTGNVIDIPLLSSDLAPDKTVKIHFNFLDAISPKTAGVGPDDRFLAIGMEKAIFY